jgi:hypothetical protein
MNRNRFLAAVVALILIALYLAPTSRGFALAADDKAAGLLPVEESKLLGGEGGGAYRTYGIDQRISPDARITRITARHSNSIHFLVLHVHVGGKDYESQRCGEYGGADAKVESIEFAMDEVIKSIDVFANKDGDNSVVCRLLVRTDKQAVEIGVAEVGEFIGTMKCPEGERIVGICGRAGSRLDSIGLQTIKK